ncbi:MAG: anthranilate phosphoribosyltransferase [Opitutae bacterium]|nr:anthranilate phosphoribosyltransferase [Opitutae bacterium]
MHSLAPFTAQLGARRDLTAADITAAAHALAAAEVSDLEKAVFLTALADKGETADEVAAMAAAFRTLSINPGLEQWAARAIDVVGTGGDHAGGFNVSSMVTLVLSCLDVPVMKHGNRGITSKCGSADLLAALGVDLTASPEKLQRAMAELGFVFLFAPNYHPAFKHIAAVRRALAVPGRRTVFNFIGPLINPGRPAHVLLGTFSSAWAPRLAAALHGLGTQAGLAVFGEIADSKGTDELTTATVNQVHGFGRLATLDARWRAEDFGLRAAPFSELQGGDVATNVAIVESVLAGRGPAGLTDTIVLNAAVALWIVGRVARPHDGLGAAREALLGGAVRAKIAATREFFRA